MPPLGRPPSRQSEKLPRRSVATNRKDGTLPKTYGLPTPSTSPSAPSAQRKLPLEEKTTSNTCQLSAPNTQQQKRERFAELPFSLSQVHPNDVRDKVFVAILKALMKLENQPSSPRELSDCILQNKYVVLGGSTPYATVSSRISQHFKRSSEAKPSRKPLLAKALDESHSRKLRYYLNPDAGLPNVPPPKLRETERLLVKSTPSAPVRVTSSVARKRASKDFCSLDASADEKSSPAQKKKKGSLGNLAKNRWASSSPSVAPSSVDYLRRSRSKTVARASPTPEVFEDDLDMSDDGYSDAAQSESEDDTWRAANSSGGKSKPSSLPFHDDLTKIKEEPQVSKSRSEIPKLSDWNSLVSPPRSHSASSCSPETNVFESQTKLQVCHYLALTDGTHTSQFRRKSSIPGLEVSDYSSEMMKTDLLALDSDGSHLAVAALPKNPYQSPRADNPNMIPFRDDCLHTPRGPGKGDFEDDSVRTCPLSSGSSASSLPTPGSSRESAPPVPSQIIHFNNLQLNTNDPTLGPSVLSPRLAPTATDVSVRIFGPTSPFLLFSPRSASAYGDLDEGGMLTTTDISGGLDLHLPTSSVFSPDMSKQLNVCPEVGKYHSYIPLPEPNHPETVTVGELDRLLENRNSGCLSTLSYLYNTGNTRLRTTTPRRLHPSPISHSIANVGLGLGHVPGCSISPNIPTVASASPLRISHKPSQPRRTRHCLETQANVSSDEVGQKTEETREGTDDMKGSTMAETEEGRKEEQPILSCLRSSDSVQDGSEVVRGPAKGGTSGGSGSGTVSKSSSSAPTSRSATASRRVAPNRSKKNEGSAGEDDEDDRKRSRVGRTLGKKKGRRRRRRRREGESEEEEEEGSDDEEAKGTDEEMEGTTRSPVRTADEKEDVPLAQEANRDSQTDTVNVALETETVPNEEKDTEVVQEEPTRDSQTDKVDVALEMEPVPNEEKDSVQEEPTQDSQTDTANVAAKTEPETQDEEEEKTPEIGLVVIPEGPPEEEIRQPPILPEDLPFSYSPMSPRRSHRERKVTRARRIAQRRASIMAEELAEAKAALAALESTIAIQASSESESDYESESNSDENVRTGKECQTTDGEQKLTTEGTSAVLSLVDLSSATTGSSSRNTSNPIPAEIVVPGSTEADLKTSTEGSVARIPPVMRLPPVIPTRIPTNPTIYLTLIDSIPVYVTHITRTMMPSSSDEEDENQTSNSGNNEQNLDASDAKKRSDVHVTYKLLRRVDSGYVNATTLLKAGGMDTEQERSIVLSLEVGRIRVRRQGSELYGTWIPLPRGRALAATCSLQHRLGPFLNDNLDVYFPSPLPITPSTMDTTTVPSVTDPVGSQHLLLASTGHKESRFRRAGLRTAIGSESPMLGESPRLAVNSAPSTEEAKEEKQEGSSKARRIKKRKRGEGGEENSEEDTDTDTEVTEIRRRRDLGLEPLIRRTAAAGSSSSGGNNHRRRRPSTSGGTAGPGRKKRIFIVHGGTGETGGLVPLALAPARRKAYYTESLSMAKEDLQEGGGRDQKKKKKKLKGGEESELDIGGSDGDDDLR